MDTRSYVDSGTLELYVYGLLSEEENSEIARLAAEHQEIQSEILSIELAIVNLSTSFSPFLSAENFAKIREKLFDKHQKTVQLKPRSSFSQSLGWAAAFILLLGGGYLFYQLNESNRQVVATDIQKTQLQDSLIQLDIRNRQSETVLAVIRDKNTVTTYLGGQAAAPEAFAKTYWNRESQAVFIDAAGLPAPPEGKVYQIWALKLNPLTPTSIGLLENFTAENSKVFSVSATSDADAFGITLEPAGGSTTPTMDQLYTMGVVKV